MQRVLRVRHVVGTISQGVKSLPTAPHIRRQFASSRQHRAPKLRNGNTTSRPAQQAKGVPAEQPEPAPWVKEEGKKKPLDFKNLPPGTVGAALLLGGLAYYLGELFVAANKPCDNPHIAEISEQKDVAARYDETADSFDSEVGMSEWLMGINKTREQLAAGCQGHVLEVSCGTGRNLGYYDVSVDGRMDSLTLLDLSAPMIEVCKKKWQALYSEYKKPGWFSSTSALNPDLKIRFATGSALGEMPLAPTDQPKKYDTIIQTMGLCSTDKPKELLENLVKHLDTSNPDARILLLEHGRSYREWMNKILDNSAQKHAELHGCWYNRDIGAIVEQAAENTGLEVSRQRRKHLGTTWLFELKPKVVTSKTAITKPISKSSEASDESSDQQQSGGWRSWVGLK
ncbi:hypothetical protein CKM354_000086800 [Cercospora kikuchii]|uniref:S-adenosyl-L-methionine-dependent methyltransferase n=1 Tax=Cercospora kikuchii TaxID=84275 RepID=A0A9P3C666_9PEZI|nr:uncharacterized protein CKM354_000086800 [Cercospora kikuchii]GIZ37422.1 hypothetical protein CKM354_000086800 [Cercospora kikuchii]